MAVHGINFRSKTTGNPSKDCSCYMQALYRYETVDIQLYKSIIRPILVYPSIPLNILSKSRMIKLQAVWNQALIWTADVGHPKIPPVEQIHEYFRVKPLTCFNKSFSKYTLKLTLSLKLMHRWTATHSSFYMTQLLNPVTKA